MKSLEDYEASLMLRSAVERQFLINGEAMNRLLKTDAELVATITDTRKVIRFRNILVHGYDAVQDSVVWKILVDDLPVLGQEVDSLLNQRPTDAVQGAG
jgi:uncharacterized protein with HEPN domain